MSDEAIIDEILRREGWPKFTRLPADRGGPTKGGITLDAYAEFMRRPVPLAELEGLSEFQARTFYRWRHITGPRFDEIVDPHLRELVVDAGVHHGPAQAAKWLQAAAGVVQDGRVGPITLREVNARDPDELYLRIVSARVRLFGRLVSNDAELKRARDAGFNLQAIFAAGWNNRAAEFIEAYAARLAAAQKRA